MNTLFRNTLGIAAGTLSSQLFSFILAPILVARLGLTLFGVWTIVGVIAVYASVLDVGVVRALSRFIALHDARGEIQEVRECVGLGLITFTGIGLVVLPLAWFAGPLLAGALGHETADQMRQILVAMAVILTVQGYSSVLQSLPQGLRRMVPPNVAIVAGNVVNFAASVGVLIASRSLVPYAWVNAGAETVGVLFILVSVRYVWRSRMAVLPSRVRAREVLGFSTQSQLVAIADIINMQSDKIVLGFVIGPRAAAIYQLGASIAGGVRVIAIISIGAITPTATAAIVKQGRTVVREMALRYLPQVLGVGLPLFAVTALVSPFLLTAWIHHHAPGVVAATIALLAAFAANFATGVPSTLAIADGRPGFVARNSMWTSALNLVLSIALAEVLGLIGVVIATVVAMATMGAVFIVSFARSYGISSAELLRAVAGPVLLSAGVGAILAPGVVLASTHAGGRGVAAAWLVGFALLYAVAYFVLASRMGILPARLTLRRRARDPAIV